MAGGPGAEEYHDIPGFCRTANIDEIRDYHYVLTPGRYVGAEERREDDVPFAERFEQLNSELHALIEEGHQLDDTISHQLNRVVSNG